MKKASEIFEGENSSLRKTYEEAVKNELKQCTKCHTMKNIEGDSCARCEEKDTKSVSGKHSGKDVYGKIEQEIMEMFDEKFFETPEGHRAVIASWSEGEQKVYKRFKSFISHIITLVQKDERQNLLKELQSNKSIGDVLAALKDGNDTQ